MRKLLFLIIISPAFCLAENNIFTCKNNSVLKAAEAKLYLEKTQKAYADVNTMQAEFGQDSYLAALEASEHSSGNVYFSKPGKMKWQYRRPEEQEFLIIENSIWFYQTLDKQVVVDNFSKVLISDLPVAFILGLGDLSKSFNVEKACIASSGESILFTMVPKSQKVSHGQSDDRLERFELLVNNGNYLPQAAKIYDIASNVNTFYLNHMKINESISEDIYSTEFPEGTDIDDRRKER